MNNEQNNMVEGTAPSPMPVDNPTPSIVPSAEQEMTTAVVNPNFMEEVEVPIAPATPAPQEQVVPEPVQNAPASVEPEKKKKGINKIVLIVIIIIAVLVVAIGTYVGYQFIGVNPKNIHEKVINQMFASADKFADKMMVNYNSDAKTIKNITNISFNTNLDELKMINDYSFKLETGIDKVSNYANYKLTFLEKNRDLLNMNYYLLNNKMYMESKDLYDKVIEIGDYQINTEDFINIYDTYNNENISYLIDVFEKGFKSSFEDGKYDRKLENVKINGKDVKAFNNSYVIDEATYYSMNKSILTTIRNDDKAMTIITDMINNISSASILNSIYSVNTEIPYNEFDDFKMTKESNAFEVTKEQVISMFDELIKELSDPELTGSTQKVYFNVYTSMITNEILAVKLLTNEDGKEYNIIDYYVDGDVSHLTINLAEDDNFVIKVSTKGNTSDYKIIYEKESLLSGTIINSENKVEFTMRLDLSSLMPDFIISLSVVSESKENGSNMEFKISANYAGQDYEALMKIDNVVAYDENITKPNVSGAIDIEDVDEEKIEENLLKALEGTALYELLESNMRENDFDPEDFDNDLDIYSEYCDEATNCKCEGISCTCRYLNDDWKYEDIICPNPNI